MYLILCRWLTFIGESRLSNKNKKKHHVKRSSDEDADQWGKDTCDNYDDQVDLDDGRVPSDDGEDHRSDNDTDNIPMMKMK